MAGETGPPRGQRTGFAGVTMMDQLLLLALAVAALVGILASLSILRRDRPGQESPFAASTEGEKRCPNCGMGNLWTDARCVSCGADLPG